MSAANLTCNILSHTLQDGPINLLCPKFNLTLAKTDSAAIKAEISSKIIRLATPFVLNSLFNQLCPGDSKEPHAALNHVRQTYNDANGNTVFGSTLKGPLCCYGCGGPHPWSCLKNGIHVIKCPNASNPGISQNAKKVIKHI